MTGEARDAERWPGGEVPLPLWRTLGIHVLEAGGGRSLMGLAMTPALGTLRAEVMHGGAIASLVDAAAGVAIRSTRGADEPPWRGMATTDLGVSYLDAATSNVTAEGRVLRVGRSIAFVQVDVRDAAGTLVAVGRVTATIAR